jgi:hypothetical protein
MRLWAGSAKNRQNAGRSLKEFVVQKKEIFRKKHELWITAFFLAQGVESRRLYFVLESLAQTQLKHLGWLGDRIIEDIRRFDYPDYDGRQEIPRSFNLDHHTRAFEPMNEHEITDFVQTLLEEILVLSEPFEGPLFERMGSDDGYFTHRLEQTKPRLSRDARVLDALNPQKSRELADLTSEQRLKLEVVLQNQSAKEYATAMSFLYVQVHNERADLTRVFSDLIDESLMHLKHYLRLLASLGQLATPAPCLPESYQISDLEGFIRAAIKEELLEQQELLELKAQFDYEQFRQLVDFVIAQERYHIHLLEGLLSSD